MKKSSPASRSLIGVLAVGVVLLAGCASGSAASNTGQNLPSVATTPNDSVATTNPDQFSSWPHVDESGTGPTTITIPNPSPDALYLTSTFNCSGGEASVELQEDPRVFQAGPCGGSSSYQMPLPTDSATYTIAIDIEPTATFTFTGTFEPR
jgi:hypothetical protein